MNTQLASYVDHGGDVYAAIMADTALDMKINGYELVAYTYVPGRWIRSREFILQSLSELDDLVRIAGEMYVELRPVDPPLSDWDLPDVPMAGMFLGQMMPGGIILGNTLELLYLLQ